MFYSMIWSQVTRTFIKLVLVCRLQPKKSSHSGFTLKISLAGGKQTFWKNPIPPQPTIFYCFSCGSWNYMHFIIANWLKSLYFIVFNIIIIIIITLLKYNYLDDYSVSSHSNKCEIISSYSFRVHQHIFNKAGPLCLSLGLSSSWYLVVYLTAR